MKLVESKAFPKVDPDEAFLKITEAQMKDIEKDIARRPAANTEQFDWLVVELASEIVQALPPDKQSSFQTSVAVGCLEHTSVNAQIFCVARTIIMQSF